MKKIYTTLAATLLTAASFAQDAFWTPTTYKGAFPVTDNTPATDWTSGWSNFDPENTVYPATTQTVSTDITTNKEQLHNLSFLRPTKQLVFETKETGEAW